MEEEVGYGAWMDADDVVGLIVLLLIVAAVAYVVVTSNLLPFLGG